MKDHDFISKIQARQSELGKQAQEIFDDGGNEGIQDKVTQNEESNKYSRELLESLTTGKSCTQLYQEAVDEQNKQKLLIKQISDTINNIELTFEQKQTIIDQLEQECGNMMYVIAFNTLVENHTPPLFSLENYQQLLDIDKFIQERRDRDIDKFMEVIIDLVNQSTTVNDPVARGDIIIKMTILMILGSGINIRKIHEVELMRLKQEFAGLFFSIQPGKKGSGTKKLLQTIKKSYTSVELSVNLHEKYPPLAQFVDMIDDLLKSSKDKDRQKKVGREKFVELHNSIFIFQHNKVADAIDNIGDPKKNEKLLNDRNKIANHPQRMEQYFMFLYLASCFPFLENFKKNNFKQNHIVYRLNNNAIRYMVDNLPVNIQGHGEVFGYIFKQGIVSHSLTNTSRNRSMDILYTFDIDSMDDEVLSFVLQQGVVLCRLLSNVLPFERLVRLLPKEHILKQIQSGSFPLKEFIDVYGFYNLQANPDGMWILMKCMVEELEEQFEERRYNDVQFDAFGNTYYRKVRVLKLSGGEKYYDPKRFLVGKSLDGRSITFDYNETVISAGEYVTTNQAHNTGYQNTCIYKDLTKVYNYENHKNEGAKIIGEVANDCFVRKKGDRYEFHRRGMRHPGMETFKDPNILLSGVSDGLIQKVDGNNHRGNTFSYLNPMCETVLFLDQEKYDSSGDFHEGLAQVAQKHTKGIITTYTYGFIDKTGKEVIPCIYDSVSDFSEGLCGVYKNGAHYFINQQNERALTIDENFSKEYLSGVSESRTKSFYLQQAHPFACGFTRAEYKTQIYPARFGGVEFPEFHTRFYDKQGKLLRFPGSMIITTASDFCGGIAKVQLQDGSRGLIDIFGNYYPIK